MFLKDASWLNYYWFYKEQNIIKLWHTTTLFCIFLVKHFESFDCKTSMGWDAKPWLRL